MADGKDIFQNALIMALASGNGAEMKLEEKEAMPGTEDIEVTASEGFDALSKVTVAGDPNLIPENIAIGKSIFGVRGSHQGGEAKPQTSGAAFAQDRIVKIVLINHITEYTSGGVK